MAGTTSTVKPSYCEIPTATLAYRKWGKGRPIYLLHGGPGASGSYWPAAAPWIGDIGEAYALDMRGHGLSTRQGPYSIAQFAVDVEAFCEAQGHESPILVGHSYGALIALEAALKVSPSALVVIGGFTSLLRTALHPRGIITKSSMAASLLAWNGKRAFGGDPDTLNYLSGLLRAGRGIFEGDSTEARQVENILLSSAVEPLDAVFPLQWDLLFWSVDSKLKNLRASTLAVAGQHDSLAVTQLSRLSCRIPFCETAVVEGAGHSPFIDRPVEFQRIVRSFLTRQGT